MWSIFNLICLLGVVASCPFAIFAFQLLLLLQELYLVTIEMIEVVLEIVVNKWVFDSNCVIPLVWRIVSFIKMAMSRICAVSAFCQGMVVRLDKYVSIDVYNLYWWPSSIYIQISHMVRYRSHQDKTKALCPLRCFFVCVYVWHPFGSIYTAYAAEFLRSGYLKKFVLYTVKCSTQ